MNLYEFIKGLKERKERADWADISTPKQAIDLGNALHHLEMANEYLTRIPDSDTADPDGAKTLSVVDMDGLLEQVPDVVIHPEDAQCPWTCIFKASSQREGWMKSTKVMDVPGGTVVQTETQQRNPDGSYSLSQGLVFVPVAKNTGSAKPVDKQPKQ